MRGSNCSPADGSPSSTSAWIRVTSLTTAYLRGIATNFHRIPFTSTACQHTDNSEADHGRLDLKNPLAGRLLVRAARTRNHVDAVARSGDDVTGNGMAINALCASGRPGAAATGRKVKPIGQETSEANSSDVPPSAVVHLVTTASGSNFVGAQIQNEPHGA